MTLQQLKYVTAVAETGTISGAAQALFLSQPSLTAAIHDLEQELNITIFSRTNRGVALTPAGDEFLGYARQVLEQTDLIEERYTGSAPGDTGSACPPSTIPSRWRPLWTCCKSTAGRSMTSASGRPRPKRSSRTWPGCAAKLACSISTPSTPRCSPGSSGSTSWSSTLCSPPAPTCSSAKQIPWPVARPSPWTTWPPTPGCPMSRGSTTPSTSPRRS